ncbi:Glyoxalase/Bleomycin resistance protein/Dihydroxybiphenyl dioxygenase [Dactylonectria estremocensis]|uniref:Glyoxalase/Bleomycin resistance protein/Dihydroxybiphenyl dioxygenase n=1 Tax=Dactylonectria estremocensis TaxID=1079267 RepID=A0A9P9DGE2_9HYPO|nr:Glyoxalase/Bleomycin resistance protein/Dihydroxybiphenyl dioxygenase [Dactylonectria estremocensis]
MRFQLLCTFLPAILATTSASPTRECSLPPSINDSSIVPSKLRFGHIGLSVANITLETQWYRENAADIRVEFRQQLHSISDGRNPTNVTELGNVRGVFNWSLQVDNVDAIYRDLVAAGVDIFQEPVDVPTGVRFCMIRDPEGNIIELLQY